MRRLSLVRDKVDSDVIHVYGHIDSLSFHIFSLNEEWIEDVFGLDMAELFNFEEFINIAPSKSEVL